MDTKITVASSWQWQISIDNAKSWWAHLDSNQGQTGYEPVALAN